VIGVFLNNYEIGGASVSRSEQGNGYRVLVGKPEGKNHLKDVM
jgi:hypothetical protein